MVRDRWASLVRGVARTQRLLEITREPVGVVGLTQQGTATRIAAAERQAKSIALAQILPAGSYDNNLLDHPRQVHDPLLGNRSSSPAYIATLNGAPSAVMWLN